MFKWLNKQGVESSDGFAVQFTGRFTAEYREGHKIISLSVEDGFSNFQPCIILRSNAFNKWDSNEGKLSENEKLRIVKNFKDACSFQGLEVVIED
ncbi:MAG TPA: hypothetical protein PKC70_16030 [Cellvibrionaceae bacterium]|nr:hypothetical protein [Cellvibrionaceae bacterium]